MASRSRKQQQGRGRRTPADGRTEAGGMNDRQLDNALRALRNSNDPGAVDDDRAALAAPIGYTRKHGGLPPTRKSLGQNWLVDPQVTRQIASQLAAGPGDLILEIGPGGGALTAELLRSGADVCAVEIDRRMVDVLSERWPAEDRLTVHHADILRADIGELTDGRPCFIAGNLPYNITSSFLFKLFDENLARPGAIRQVIVLLQKEAAERVAAGPGESETNVLSVFLRVWGEPELVMTVPRDVFDPPPKVDAGLIRFDVSAEPRVPIDHWDTFRRLVKGSFANRRKMLRNTVPAIPHLGPVDGIEFDWSRRPQDLSVAEFAWLANQLVPKKARDHEQSG